MEEPVSVSAHAAVEARHVTGGAFDGILGVVEAGLRGSRVVVPVDDYICRGSAEQEGKLYGKRK